MAPVTAKISRDVHAFHLLVRLNARYSSCEQATIKATIGNQRDKPLRQRCRAGGRKMVVGCWLSVASSY